jgi:DDE domain
MLGRRETPGRVNETYIKVRSQWVYPYRAVDKQGRTVDFLLRKRRDMAAAKRFEMCRLTRFVASAESKSLRAARQRRSPCGDYHQPLSSLLKAEAAPEENCRHRPVHNLEQPMAAECQFKIGFQNGVLPAQSAWRIAWSTCCSYLNLRNWGLITVQYHSGRAAKAIIPNITAGAISIQKKIVVHLCNAMAHKAHARIPDMLMPMTDATKLTSGTCSIAPRGTSSYPVSKTFPKRGLTTANTLPSPTIMRT